MNISKVLLAALVLGSSATAMDAASFLYLGANRNKTHAAWLMYGVQDGSGYPWATLEVLSLVPFRVAERISVLVNDGESPPEKGRDSVLVLADAALVRFGILPEFGGQVLLDHKLTDAGVPPDTVVFAMDAYYTWYPGITYTMILEQTPSGEENPDAPWFPEPVTPKITITDGRSRALLFRESTPAEPYRLAFAYRIAKVIRLSGSRLLVVLNVMTPGFEGPDLRYRVLAVEFPISWRY